MPPALAAQSANDWTTRGVPLTFNFVSFKPVPFSDIPISIIETPSLHFI